YLLAGVGAYALAKHFGLRSVASLSAAIVFMVGPYMASQTQHFGLIETASWTPFVALFARRSMIHGRVRDAVFASLCWSQCFLAGVFAAAVPVAMALGIYWAQAIVRNALSRNVRPYSRTLVIGTLTPVLGAGVLDVRALPYV